MNSRIRIRVHPAGLVLFIAVFLFADSHLAIAALLALAVHESAHLLVMAACGMRGCLVEITPFGGMMDAKQFEKQAIWKQLVVACAGVAASAISAWICTFLHGTLFVQRFFQANLSLAIFNALPLWPLDGARAIAALGACLGIEPFVKKTLSWFSMVSGIFLVVIGLIGVWNGMFNLSLLAAGPYLCYASRAERVTSRVRHLGCIERKLSDNEVVPVTLWAGNTENAYEQFIRRVANGHENRYQVFLSINPSTGTIQKWYTEQEMLKQKLEQDRI